MRQRLMTHPLTRRVRSVARQFGLTKIVANALKPADYEERFSQSLIAAVGNGDVVWDVGANQGYYTAIFSDLVGDGGQVAAFEPAGDTFRALGAAVGDRSNVALFHTGLSNADGEAEIMVGVDDLAATSRVAGAEAETDTGAKRETIQLARGETLVSQGKVTSPNVIKIDVEGHEWNVVAGLGNLLESPDLRRILIEVHFGILDGDGRAHEVDLIVERLKTNGFKINWTDASHIDASRTDH